ncbi:MAG: ABC transporter permease [Thermoanaerobaculia bacterium]
MGNVLTIYRREIATAFNSPIAYIFICAFLAIMAFFFFIFGQFFAQMNPDLRYYYRILPFAFFIFIPAVSMRFWSEEKKQGTIELLMTLPMKTWEVVAGKFLAGYTIVALSLLLTVVVPITVAFVLPIDARALIASYVGALLIAGVYLAIGSWISALTENQIVAFMVSVVACALVCFMGYPNVTDWINQVIGGLGRFIGYFGTFAHYMKFEQGQVSMVDVVYALSMIGLFLGLNNFAVEGRKY